MIDRNITNYIKEARKQNITEVEIRNNLLKAEWSENDVSEALNINQIPAPIPPKPDINLTSHNMWDAFEHIIMFISLYVSATSLALILHFFIDKWFPGVGAYSYYYSGSSTFTDSLLSGYYSALIVASPIFVILFLRITRKTKSNPSIKNLDSRKKLIYFTLVITFIIVLFKLTSIIYNFLMGNITMNFVLHFLVTVGISGAIFSYYINQVVQDRKI